MLFAVFVIIQEAQIQLMLQFSRIPNAMYSSSQHFQLVYFCRFATFSKARHAVLYSVGSIDVLQTYKACNVAPDLMEGFGLMKSFREIIQNQLLFEGFGIMKSFWDRN